MQFLAYNTLIVLAGTSLLGAVSGLVGTFAVLRRRALTGDALAHAALPGLCIAFVIMQRRSLPGMLFGAFVSGVIGVLVVSALRRGTRVKEDAAIGIVLSVFYGAGIVLSSIIQRRTSSGSQAGLESWILGKTAGMIFQDVVFIGGVLLVCLVLVVCLYKEFKVISFDPEFASVQGWPVGVLDLMLMTMVALTVVVGLPAVGVVMMAALLIIPAAAARFWTNRLSRMLVIAAIFGALTGAVGTAVTTSFEGLPAGPMIVLVGSSIFAISMMLAPRRGVLANWLRRARFRRKVRGQRVLRELFDLSRTDSVVPLNVLQQRRSWTSSELNATLSRLGRAGLVTENTAGWSLTDSGLEHAARVTRGQRLWHLFLSEYAEVAGNFADLDAEQIDEVLPAEMVQELEARLSLQASSSTV